MSDAADMTRVAGSPAEREASTFERPRRVAPLRSVPILLLLLVSCELPAAMPLPASCDGANGGRPGAQTQLRFIEATDTQVVLTFGPSSESNDFGVPQFGLEPLEGTSAARAYRLRVNGASILNPDGTPSYNGLKAIEPGGRTVRGITLVDDSLRTMTFTIAVERVACPFVASKTYQYGKSPRAQIVVTFGGAASLTLETVSSVVGGAPSGTPVQASGMGYTPGATVRIYLAGQQVTDTAANADGAFDIGLWLPDREPGLYLVTASDGRGRAGTTTVRVMARRTKH